MTDPQYPASGDAAPPPYTPPAAPPPAASAPPAYPQQPYASAPPPAYGPPVAASVPGRTLGIVALILSFFMQPIALILGIVALVQSKKAGHKNGFALAAIIISSVLIVIGIIVLIVVFAIIVPQALEIARQCAELGPGIHEINGIPVNCSELLR